MCTSVGTHLWPLQTANNHHLPKQLMNARLGMCIKVDIPGAWIVKIMGNFEASKLVTNTKYLNRYFTILEKG